MSLAKMGRRTSKASEESVLIKQITATHDPDGREIDVKPIFQIVEDILKIATSTTSDVNATEALEEQSNSFEVIGAAETLSSIINRLSCEISYKCMDDGDAHSTAVSLLKLLSGYSWAAKLVLTLAAFALNYGEFWLLCQIYSTNRLAQRMAVLKQLPEILEHAAVLKPHFEALNNLIKSILVLSRCIFQFTELPSEHISQDKSAYSTAVAHFPTAIYWIFRSIVICATKITDLSGMGHEYIISSGELWELSSLTHKIVSMNELLQEQFAICNQYIEEKMQSQAYEALLRIIEAVHIDNMKVLKSLIYPKDDLLPLLDGTTKRRVNLDVLRRKTVLLLISGLEISSEEVTILQQIYLETKHRGDLGSQYEMVWIPVTVRSTPWTETNQKQLEMLQSEMPWYSVYHPNMIDVAVIRYFKENLHFNKKAMVVVLDPQGKIVSPNALHMMWIWGNSAFPFTRSREEALWNAETWRLELLVDGIDPILLEWIAEGKHILLYGSNDMEWIRKFTTTAHAVAQAAQLPLEMVYAGKDTFQKEQIAKAIRVIVAEKLSYTWQDTMMIWFFWARLKSMLFSKIELRGDDEDPILHEVKKLLCYDKSGPWVLLSRGSEVIFTGNGTTSLSALLEYDLWAKVVEERGFGPAFKSHYEDLHKDLPCSRLEFETTAGRIPESMKCPDCSRSMEKLLTFSCCHN